jgi:hypothetical protein
MTPAGREFLSPPNENPGKTTALMFTGRLSFRPAGRSITGAEHYAGEIFSPPLTPEGESDDPAIRPKETGLVSASPINRETGPAKDRRPQGVEGPGLWPEFDERRNHQ